MFVGCRLNDRLESVLHNTPVFRHRTQHNLTFIELLDVLLNETLQSNKFRKVAHPAIERMKAKTCTLHEQLNRVYSRDLSSDCRKYWRLPLDYIDNNDLSQKCQQDKTELMIELLDRYMHRTFYTCLEETLNMSKTLKISYQSFYQNRECPGGKSPKLPHANVELTVPENIDDHLHKSIIRNGPTPLQELIEWIRISCSDGIEKFPYPNQETINRRYLSPSHIPQIRSNREKFLMRFQTTDTRDKRHQLINKFGLNYTIIETLTDRYSEQHPHFRALGLLKLQKLAKELLAMERTPHYFWIIGEKYGIREDIFEDFSRHPITANKQNKSVGHFWTLRQELISSNKLYNNALLEKTTCPN